MRLLLTLMAALSICMAANAQKVTVNLRNRPMAEAFAEVMRQADLNYAYPSGLLDGLHVTVKADGEEVAKLLDRMFAGTAVQWKRIGANITLSRAAVQEAEAGKTVVTVSGYVREAHTREPVIGATVQTAPGHGTVTNRVGFYSLSVPLGQATVSVHAPAYSPLSTTIDVTANTTLNFALRPVHELQEVVISDSRNATMAMTSPEIGYRSLSAEAIRNTPVVFGEADLVKSLQLMPGITAGVEGMAGMTVHGGTQDQNMYMLDNIPLYQVNHFGGLFSAFNSEAVKNVDFYATTFPAKFDGRLSSFVDVYAREGSAEAHHGSVRLGLTSGSFNIDGPIRKGTTTYSVALRRSWYDVLTIPLFAIVNSLTDDEKLSTRYAFTDFNAKVSHRFSHRSSANVMFYFGQDELLVSSDWKGGTEPMTFRDKDSQKMRWGNIMAKAGWDYQLSPNMFGEFAAAWTRYSSLMSPMQQSWDHDTDGTPTYKSTSHRTDNIIDDMIVRADLSWEPGSANKVRFGVNYTHHTFMPQRTHYRNEYPGHLFEGVDNGETLRASEGAAYIGDDLRVGEYVRLYGGVNLSAFNIQKHTDLNLSPRAGVRWSPNALWSFKAGYARTVQYVHQITDSYLSLPTDRWVPVADGFKPQTADKISIGAYRRIGACWTVQAEAYWKWMHNLIDYKDDFYLASPTGRWSEALTSGYGSSKGIDLMLTREAGPVTGHIAYTLMWADRHFAGKNNGVPYGARNDNRHQINVLLNWNIDHKWTVNVSWTGMSGNLVTLPTQTWLAPELPGNWTMGNGPAPVIDRINNFRLPFYHRMDLGVRRHTKHGYWDFSFYNVYCNMNPIGVRRGWRDVTVTEPAYPGDIVWTGTSTVTYSKPVFQYVRLLPIIPSVSYTWQF